MKKKLVLVILAFGIVLGAGNMVKADESKTGFSDITDGNVREAVEKAHDLKIIEGYGDGKFYPENQMTRAEAVKMLVCACNYDEAAKLANNDEPYFTDILAGYWAKGYINLATTLQVIKGDGNKIFSPEREVNKVEAITMLLRTLGYQDSMFAEKWPKGYMGKASELKLSEEAEILSTDKISRGEFALLVNKALDLNVIKAENKDGTITYKVDPDVTLYKRFIGK